MIVVLEGPDGSGKTTLAQYLKEIWGWNYIHTGPPKQGENLLVSYAQTLFNARRMDGHTVIDRLHLGESVYGPILRGVDLIGDEGLTILNRIISSYQVRVLLCLPPLEKVLEIWRGRRAGEYVQDSNWVKRIYATYAKMPLRVWDFTEIPTASMGRLIMNEAIIKGRGNPVFDHVVGSLSPTFLFVGEKANQKELDLPWVSLQGSSHFLFEMLKETGYQESEMAFVNAKRLDGQANDLEKIWDELKRPVVVCLGAVARNAVRSFPRALTFPLNHPAYQKRFLSGKILDYAIALKAIRREVLGVRQLS